MRTDYLGLEAFVAIAELGSFNRAAAYLNLSQTALSHRIRKIETDLGVQLLVRSTRDVLLTKEGQALLPQVQRNLALLSEAYDGLRKRGRTNQERLAFACLPTIANYYLPTVLRQFSEECPGIAIHLHDQPVGRIYELVQAGEVEFGISVIGAKHWDLDIREIFKEAYVLLVHRSHPLANQKTVALADLDGQHFVRINTQSTNRQLVHDALGEHSDAIIWRYEVQSVMTAMSLVA
ncbi:MAG TPA: LysR family transcriptional regulator, partial [Hyphomicrobiales bacterium]|nr:LysR family transcriptional regulator [Hyphomicrobiales bacterium]